ncbi:response regulator transcription factor [Paenibacillus sp. FA6]|uniref:response regulator transcription factor n=1 Tax=Paenibacillus sp. FA6 TaxID=3413029 RepID=UPI003F65F500
MNLMIVEDEPRLRNALGHNIPWEDHGIELIGLASNGLEALQLIEHKKPDIMIIDVQMPEMDGLTLVRKLHEQQEMKSFMKMIILSGHDNFTFAQDAMEHGVFRYLLKPAGEEEIVEAVLEARQQLRKELEQWQSKAALEQKWKDHLPNLQNNFFQHWVNEKFNNWEVLKISKDLYIDLKEDDQIAVAVVGLDPIPDNDNRFSSQDMLLLQFTMQCMAKELLFHPSCWVSTDANQQLMLVFIMEAGQPPKESMLFINSLVVKLLSQTKLVLKLTASAGICSSTGNLEEMGRLYVQAYRALQERMVYGPDIAIPYREVPKQSQQHLFAQQRLEKMLEIALETADEEKALEALSGLWEEGVKQSESADEVHEVVLYLSSLFIRIIQKQGWMVKNVVEEDIIYFQNVKLLNTQVQTWSWLMRTVKHITTFMQNQRRTTSNQVVKEILTILDLEMDQEITLHTVADRLYVNSSYLSRLFKQEMGVAFSAYVLDRKMERAKTILLEGLKVYDAARMVGYRDVSYFTKVFRKYWGVNPGECKP